MEEIILKKGNYKIVFDNHGGKAIEITDDALFEIIKYYLENPPNQIKKLV